MQEAGELCQTTNLSDLAAVLVGCFWGIYFLWTTDTINIEQLENELQRLFLSYLSPHAEGQARITIESALANHAA